MIEALKRFGATPNAYGETYGDAQNKAEEFVACTPNAYCRSLGSRIYAC